MASQDTDHRYIVQIAEIAGRYAIRHRYSDADEGRAAAELAEAAAGRADLLARYAGITLGYHEADTEAGHYERAAQLCIRAGADTALILRWIEVGRRARQRHDAGIARRVAELIRT